MRLGRVWLLLLERMGSASHEDLSHGRMHVASSETLCQGEEDALEGQSCPPPTCADSE